MSKPERVQRAIYEGDREYLRQAGRAGGRSRARKRALDREMDEAFRERNLERAAADERARQLSANEHIAPLSAYE